MKNSTQIRQKYLNLGIEEKHISYATEAVKTGKKKDIIFKNLTSDVRNVDSQIADQMLTEMYEGNGGEFKYENRNGYLYAAVYFTAAIAIGLVLIGTSKDGSFKIKLGIAFLLVVFLFVKTLITALKGKFREE